jgi:3-oxoacyl-[acyl-carrier-protein] synthase-3
VLTNHDLAQMLDTSDDWIVTRTGIKQRHIASADETILSMAKAASIKALTSANLLPQQIGMIIVCTTTPMKTFPSTACYLQQELGVAGCPAFDLNSVACSAFIYALSIADQYIKNGSINSALIVGSEVMSSIVDWTDRNTCVLFGDGAGAVVLQASSTPGIFATHLHADGAYSEILSMPLRVKSDNVAGTGLQMAGNRLFKLAVTMLGDLCEETLQASGITTAEIDWLIPHQANIRIIEAITKKLALPLAKTIITLGEQGNTSAASIPLALDKGIITGAVQPGQLLLLEAFGGGLTWGSALVRY